MLLLIDNFEQVLEAGPGLAALLDACPGVSALVTSRRPLRLRGERQIVVEPLAVPAAAAELGTVPRAVEAVVGAPAAELFVERAQRVHPGFVVGPGNVGAIADLVRRLDGLPLAIELVAARAHVLEPRQMLERLDRGIGVPDRPARTSPSGSARCARPWSGATTCWHPRSRPCSPGSGCSPTGPRSRPSSLCARDLRSPTCSRTCPCCSTTVCCGPIVSSGEGQPRFVLFLTVREFAVEQLDTAADVTAHQGQVRRLGARDGGAG